MSSNNRKVSADFDAESASGTATLPPDAQPKAAQEAQEVQEALLMIGMTCVCCVDTLT